jgi:transposase
MGTELRANLFWFNDEQWAKIEPLLPTIQPGPARKDDRRILSGIMFVLKVGCRWVDCPPEYGRIKRSTIGSTAGAGAAFGNVSSKRWRDRQHRRRKVRWTALMSKLTAAPAAEKGGLGTSDRRHAGRAEQQDSCDRR